MIQPYQRALLRSLAGNSPFAQFAQQFKSPTSFPFPVIDTTMSTSASSSATANSSSKGSPAIPKVYAGYGYRFLRSGEALPHGTQVVFNEGDPVPYYDTGRPARAVCVAPAGVHGPRPVGFYRVPTPAPAGFRVLDANEITAKGDRYHGEETPVDEKVYSNIGKTAEEAVLNYHKSGHRDAFDPKRPTCVIRKEEAPAQEKPTVPSPVDEAIERLQVISERTCRVPKPGDVRAEMNTLVAAVEAPLREQIKDARNGCKRLSETVDRQRTKIAELEAKLKNAEAKADSYLRGYTEKSAELVKAQAGSRGNVVIVRRDGFSRPMDICPSYGCGFEPELPRYIKFYDQPSPSYASRGVGSDYAKVTFETLYASNTGKKDGFGRTIFEQV